MSAKVSKVLLDQTSLDQANLKSEHEFLETVPNRPGANGSGPNGANAPFAEVIESSLQGFTAQSWDWNKFPAFGSLVTVQDKKRTLCCLVYQAHTGSMDPVRYPFPYQKTHEELLAEQPQIFEFLKTTFQCMALGYIEHERVFYVLPPEPAVIHSFVSPASLAIARQFFSSDRYISLMYALGAAVPVGVDELFLACLRYQAELGLLTEEKVLALTPTFSLVTANDYRRMKLLLQRVEALL